MAGYKPYPEYKDSGVEWLGEVPRHWGGKRLKFAVNLINEKVDAQAADLEYMGLEHIESWSGRRLNDENANSEGVAARFLPGDVLFGKLRPYLAKVYLAQHEGLVSTEALVVRSAGYTDPAFLRHFMVSQDFIRTVDSSTYGSKMPRASWDFIGNLPMLLPHIEEQQAIARFLDHKTAQIDALIAKKQTLLEKLAEKRTALISHAVTKGLDPNVKMKDSGVEWLGQVPAHWKAVRLKHVTHQIVDGAHFTPTYVSEGVPFLRVTDIVKSNGSEIDIENLKFIPQDEHAELCKRCKPQYGDVLYSKNGTIGIPRVVDWDYDFSIFVSLCLLKINREIVDANFLCMSLLGKLTEHQISIGAKSNTVTNLHLDKIKEFWVCLPPLDEQIEIVDHLSNLTGKVDKSLGAAKYAIEKLKEYRSALITQAVTGKIDVRSIKIPEATVKGQAA